MRKIIRTNDLTWDAKEVFESILNLAHLPELIIIETVEDE